MKRFIVLGSFIFVIFTCFNFYVGLAQRQPPIPQSPTPCEPSFEPCPTPEPSPPQITSLTFVQVNSPLDCMDANCTEKRIFPDKTSPTDNQNRKVVRVKATLSSTPVPGVNFKMLFKAFDVDAPSNDTIIDPNNNSGNDNRPYDPNNPHSGLPGTLSASLSQPGTTNETAVVILDNTTEVSAYLTVTMQPGNNVVVAATINAPLDGVTINGTGLKDASGANIPTATIKKTELLTTWRKLHIEIDTMGAVHNNFIEGTIPDAVEIRRFQTATITLSPTPNIQLEENRFENGRLVINGSIDLPVSCNILNGDTCNTANTVNVVNTNSTAVNLPPNSSFKLYDDDDYNNNNGTTKIGDENEAILQFSNSFQHLQSADGNYLDGTPKNILASAYIRPEYNWAAQYNNNVPFDVNADDNEISSTATTALMEANRGTKTSESNDFWVAYLIIGYQPAESKEFDRNLTNATVGITAADTCDCYKSSSCPRMTSCGSSIPFGGYGSIVFVETSQDFRKFWANPPPPLLPKIFNEAETSVPHELGHQLGLKGDEISTIFKVMDYQNPQTSSGNVVVGFHSEHINILRGRVKSPGQ